MWRLSLWNVIRVLLQAGACAPFKPVMAPGACLVSMSADAPSRCNICLFSQASHSLNISWRGHTAAPKHTLQISQHDPGQLQAHRSLQQVGSVPARHCMELASRPWQPTCILMSCLLLNSLRLCSSFMRCLAPQPASGHTVGSSMMPSTFQATASAPQDSHLNSPHLQQRFVARVVPKETVGL